MKVVTFWRRPKVFGELFKSALAFDGSELSNWEGEPF